MMKWRSMVRKLNRLRGAKKTLPDVWLRIDFDALSSRPIVTYGGESPVDLAAPPDGMRGMRVHSESGIVEYEWHGFRGVDEVCAGCGRLFDGQETRFRIAELVYVGHCCFAKTDAELGVID